MRSLRATPPILVLFVLVALLVVITIITREISGHAGFLVERQIVLLVWLAGLLIAGVVFAWFVRRAMRRDASRSRLLLMVLTVLLLASPLSLSLLQHPAP
jgi:Kef-type K+ transport system membrane component KefB